MRSHIHLAHGRFVHKQHLHHMHHGHGLVGGAAMRKNINSFSYAGFEGEGRRKKVVAPKHVKHAHKPTSHKRPLHFKHLF